MSSAPIREALPAHQAWSELDEAGREALRQAWEAVRTGNIGVGAVVTDPAGELLVATRNRVRDTAAPPGETAGTSVAHAELNALAHLPFRAPRELVLTTSLQPCLQCAAAIRMAPIARVRVLGSDRLWDGCHDFSALNPWVGRRPPVPVVGPRGDAVGVFATFISRLGPGLLDEIATWLHAAGDGPILDLVAEVEGAGLAELTTLPVEEALAQLWPALEAVAGGAMPPA